MQKQLVAVAVAPWLRRICWRPLWLFNPRTGKFRHRLMWKTGNCSTPSPRGARGVSRASGRGGGFEVDMEWKEGQLVQATIRANRDGEFRIYAQDKLSKLISLKKGQSKVWPPGT